VIAKCKQQGWDAGFVNYEPCNLPTMTVVRMNFSHPFDHDFTFAMFKRA